MIDKILDFLLGQGSCVRDTSVFEERTGRSIDWILKVPFHARDLLWLRRFS